MKFLVDSNILSEPTEPEPDVRVKQWIGRFEAQIVVDSIIIGEVHYGILKLPSGIKRQMLERWFDGSS